jgi:hypothetical protein
VLADVVGVGSVAETAGKGSASVGRGVSADLDVEGLATEYLEAEITTLAGHIAAATCRWLLLVGEFDRRQAWESWGCRSCAQWLSWQCAMGLRAAREHVRVARALTELPVIRREFAEGRLSYSQARALTRVAEPQREGELVELARHATAAQLERLVRGYQRASALREQARDSYEARELVWWHEPDGSLVIHARLPANDGALVLGALQQTADRLRDAARGAGIAAAAPDPRGEGSAEPPVAPPPAPRATAQRSDEGSTEPARGPSAGQGGEGSAEPAGGPCAGQDDRGSAEPLGERPAEQPYRPQALLADALVDLARATCGGDTPADRFRVVVNVDLESLVADAPGTCRLACGTVLAPETVRRLGCDQQVTALHQANGRPRASAPAARFASPRLNRLLDQRDGGCRFPGCTYTRYLHTHHIVHWAHGGSTTPENFCGCARTTTGSCTRAATPSQATPPAGSPSTAPTAAPYPSARLAAPAAPRHSHSATTGEASTPAPPASPPPGPATGLDTDWAVTVLVNNMIDHRTQLSSRAPQPSTCSPR